METVALGMMEMLLLLAGSSGLPANDLASLIATDDYFSSRNVTLNTKEMTALAGKEAKDPKEQIQQLVAIRWLGENTAAVKKDPAAREVLEQIAAGKKAQDKHGFSKGHALQALARLDGKPLPPLTTMPEGSLLEALSLFPESMTLAGGHDLRSGKTVSSEAVLDTARRLFVKNIREPERRQAYDVIDVLGNVRVDRIAGAMKLDDNGKLNGFAVSLGGLVDSQKLTAFLFLASKGKVKVETKKGPGGETVRLIDLSQQGGVMIAFVNDSEVLFAGIEQGPELIDKMLKLKGEKKGSVLTGPYAKMLKEVPTQARALVVGELPAVARKELTQGKSPLRAIPKQFVAHAMQVDKKMNFELRGLLKDQEEAQSFTEGALGLKQMALRELENVPADARVPKEILKRAQDALKALKATTEESTTKLTATIDSMAVLGDVLMWLLRATPASPDQ